jgi:hypothetical protein
LAERLRDYGHGRVERGDLTVTTALHGYLDGPGAAFSEHACTPN